ncbi:MAG: hypothetical protein F4X26_03490 [Chloroflexi bacterium]|nr:hypothetical protein [Chloroflexota bacterium]
MLFGIMLGLVLGAAAVLLIEQWLRGELVDWPGAPRRLGGGSHLGSRGRAAGSSLRDWWS